MKIEDWRPFSGRYIVAAVSVIAGAWFMFRPTGISQLVSMLTALVTVLAALIGAVRLRRQRWRGLVATGACLVSTPIGLVLGGELRDIDFMYRRRLRYEAVVAELERRRPPVSAERSVVVSLRPEDEDLADRVFARRSGSGVLRVEFFWGGGFPVKRSAYVHISSGDVSAGATAGWRYQRLTKNWFYASD